jgi:predicted nuclease with TOPRIM domain
MFEFSVKSYDILELKDLRNINIYPSSLGYIDEVEVKKFTFPNGVEVVSFEALNYLLALIRGERDELIKETKEHIKVKAKLTKVSNRLEVIKKENETLKKELKELEAIYGSYISPFTILEELYRGVNLPYMILNKRNNFKMKISEKQFNYWVGIFIDIKIVRRIDKSNLQSLMNHKEAHDKLYENSSVWEKKNS